MRGYIICDKHGKQFVNVDDYVIEVIYGAVADPMEFLNSFTSLFHLAYSKASNLVNGIKVQKSQSGKKVYSAKCSQCDTRYIVHFDQENDHGK